MISYKHSEELYKACGGPCGLLTPDCMNSRIYEAIKLKPSVSPG